MDHTRPFGDTRDGECRVRRGVQSEFAGNKLGEGVSCAEAPGRFEPVGVGVARVLVEFGDFWENVVYGESLTVS